MLNKIYTLHIDESAKKLLIQALAQYACCPQCSDDSVVEATRLNEQITLLAPTGVVEV